MNTLNPSAKTRVIYQQPRLSSCFDSLRLSTILSGANGAMLSPPAPPSFTHRSIWRQRLLVAAGASTALRSHQPHPEL
jgi:hypothetical protein